MDAKHWTKGHTFALLFFVLLIGVFGFVTTLPSGDGARAEGAPWTWYAVMLSMSAFIMTAGHGLSGRLSGFLIDERNKMTLSRLQLAAWTVLILSAYLTLVLARLREHGMAALAVEIPVELWWLMGISTTSLVGSPLVLSTKTHKQPDESVINRSLQQQADADGVAPATIVQKQYRVGSVVANKSATGARIADLFRGDEVGNAAHLDLSKVQMFFFTFVLVLAYGFTLGSEFAELLSSAQFPALDESMVALLGISHSGYLAFKAVPHSQGTVSSVSGGTAPTATPGAHPPQASSGGTAPAASTASGSGSSTTTSKPLIPRAISGGSAPKI